MTADQKHKRVTEFEKGDKVLIVKIDAGKRALINLMNLGILTGNEIEINRSSSMHGPVVVNHRGTEVALGYHLARKIIAERT